MNILSPKSLIVSRNLRRPFHDSSATPAGVVLAVALIIFSGHVLAQTQEPTPSPNSLKKLSLDQLMNIEVTSVGKEPEPYVQAPAAIDVITNDEIRRSGASSIPEALRLADSLDVAQQNSHDWAISARGFDTSLSNKLLVLIDGRTIYSPLFSGVFWNVQDYLMEDIDRIEVISGPGGTLWGANAVNGVINITTKSAKDTQGFYMETGGGSMLRDFAGMRYGGQLAPDVYFRAYLKYFDRGPDVHHNGSNAADSWYQAQGGFRIDAYPSTENTFTLQGDYYAGNVNVDAVGDGRVSGNNLLARWSHVFTDDSNMSLQMYYDRTYLSDPIGGITLGSALVSPSGILTDNLDTYDIDFQHHFKWGDRNQFTWGLGYRFTHDSVNDAPSLGFSPDILDQNLFSGFIQDEIMVVKNVHLTLGTKIEHNDYTGFEFEPSVRLQWNVATDQMLWGAVSRAVRTPSRVDRDLSEPNSSAPIAILRGNPDFVSETLIAYELGYRAKFDKKVATSLSLFYNDYDDIRSLNPAAGTVIPITVGNDLQGQTYGAELTIDYQMTDWWRLHGGYTLLREHIHVKKGGSDFDKGLNETADPKNMFSFRSSMDLPHNVEFDAGLRWVDVLHTNSGSTPQTVPAYWELNSRLGWHATDRLEFSLVGENLLHSQHVEYGISTPNREEIVRTVYAKVSWQF